MLQERHDDCGELKFCGQVNRHRGIPISLLAVIMVKPRLLLVDDDKNTLDGLATILKRDGYNVSGVLSGYEALKLLSRKQFDVMITDVNMPGMDGLYLIREVRKRDVSVAIVVMSANSSVKTMADVTKSLSCDYYLTKPVNIHELEAILENL